MSPPPTASAHSSLPESSYLYSSICTLLFVLFYLYSSIFSARNSSVCLPAITDVQIFVTLVFDRNQVSAWGEVVLSRYSTCTITHILCVFVSRYSTCIMCAALYVQHIYYMYICWAWLNDLSELLHSKITTFLSHSIDWFHCNKSNCCDVWS